AGNVLLVEDDPQVAVLTRKFLTSLGLNVITANSLNEMRDRLIDEPPVDLLLTDVVLPGSANGPVIAEEVKRLYPNVRVLFMSGYTNNAIAMEQDTALLTKPFSREDLARKLEEVLDP
ncbi:MAG: response regulator, partial [Pseudomonadales bacterium]|nr:response regulator [Pseudomonadales bacterium]